MNFMPEEIAAAVVKEQNADLSNINWLDKRAERMLSDKSFWHRITASGNPIINLKLEMEKWIKHRNYPIT